MNIWTEGRDKDGQRAEIQTDRKTDGPRRRINSGEQTEDRRINGLMGGWAYVQMDKQADRQTDR